MIKEEKPVGRVKRLSALINLLYSMGRGADAQEKILERNYILTNGYQPPIPVKFLNQRQLRKRNRNKH